MIFRKIFLALFVGTALTACAGDNPSLKTSQAEMSERENSPEKIETEELQPAAKTTKKNEEPLFTVSAARNCGFPPDQDNRGKTFTQLAKEVSEYAASIGKNFNGTVRQLQHAATPEASEEFKAELAKCAGMV